jgi:hypothetical protein
LSPSGTVALDETFVAGVGEGSGTLYLGGGTYPFKLIGSVIGPGGAKRISARGEVSWFGRLHRGLFLTQQVLGQVL